MQRVILHILPLVIAAAVIYGQTPPATPEKAPAQTSQKAPPEVDAALRARVAQFYQFEVDGKFNQALQLVAEDTKDLFVGSGKPSYHSFEIRSIQFRDDFSKADVITVVSRLLPIEGFMGHPLPTMMPTRWKLENGQWRLYVDPLTDLPVSPFGRPMPPGMAMPALGPPGASGPPGVSRPLPAMPRNLANPRTLLPDKLSVELKSSGPSSAQVAVSNPSPWPVGLNFFDPKVAGLTVKLDRLTVQPGQKAILSIQSNGGVQIPKTPITVVVTVPQANQTIPIKVSFAN
jgi:hypothetical protein